MPIPSFTDVLVCGAGPVGLLIALGLAQQGIDTLIIEKRERRVQETLGRACTLYPRTLELLEQLDLMGQMAQSGFIGRSYAVYNNGQRMTRKAWQNMLPFMNNSFHNYILNIRQNQSEHIFRNKYDSDFGKSVYHGWQISSYKIDQSPNDGYNITAIINHAELGAKEVRCKYLVGADGGQSTVRQLADITMQGNETDYKWVRIDGRMKSDMPEPNLMFAVLETKTHGNVLWARLDRDATRIGFALTPALQAKYPDGPTEEQVVHEAIECAKPFKLEIERVDWWTYYVIKQKVAESMQKDNFVLLAGDAAHTHSSAFAQGMNTGVHDATNLIWKLSGTLKGWYKKDILDTFDSERRTAAQKLINIDRIAAAAVSGDIPVQYSALGFGNEEALRTVLETNMSFNIGLGVSYEPSIINRQPNATTLVYGTRSPDALLQSPGPSIPTRLHDITHRQSRGRWSLLIFAGRPSSTKHDIRALREWVDSNASKPPSFTKAVRTTTIVVGKYASAWDAFDGPALGDLYFDLEATAHDRYGVYPDNGAAVIIRPDGIFAFAAALDEPDKIGEFFGHICI